MLGHAKDCGEHKHALKQYGTWRIYTTRYEDFCFGIIMARRSTTGREFSLDEKQTA
jgi:hypothetical protein